MTRKVSIDQPYLSILTILSQCGFISDSLILFICAYVPRKMYISLSNDIINFFTETIDDFLSRGYGQRTMISGDFNRLNIAKLCSDNDVAALISHPTRGIRTLDKVLVSNENWYNYFDAQ